MTIHSIKLTNFQSHKDTTLDLDAGVNVVTGASDSGKTAIVRALRWLVWNKPGGTAFRSLWGGDTSVLIRLDNAIIERIRTNKTNQYVTHGPSQFEPLIYEAFGVDPPEDISTVLNIADVNLQRQHDRPFLLDSSPGQVAAYLNQVARLDIIDTALARINKWIRELNTATRNHEDRRADLEENLAQYDYLEDYEHDVAQLESDEQALDTKRAAHKALSEALRQHDKITSAMTELEALSQLSEFVDSALAIMREKAALSTEHRQINALFSRLEVVDSQLARKTTLLQLNPIVDKAIAELGTLRAAQSKADRVGALLAKLHQNSHNQNKITKTLDELHRRFDHNMQDVCPLCGTALKD